MKGIKRKLLLVGLSLAIGGTAFLSLPRNAANAATLESEDYYKLVATAIDVADTNAIESNKNPQIFDVSNSAFINAVSARKDSDTYASSIEAASAQEFSEKYTTLFSTTAGTSVGVLDNTVSTDVRGKFETNANTESWKQKIERYEYYYWFTQKYVVNIDWENENINEALSGPFKRELNNVDSIATAKALLREYGTHLYNTYVLGGKLEITKYFTQDASYQLSETEMNASTSLNVIVDTAKVDAKVEGSVDLSKYESNAESSQKYYSKLGYHAYGGDTNGAATASDLFQYKEQWATDAPSGFLYEEWTRSFNKDGVSLKVVSAEDAVAIWDILDSSVYGEQISYLKKAYDNMWYESYAEKCGDFDIPCNYINTLTYTSKGGKVNITPKESRIHLPENASVKISLSELITGQFGEAEYSLQLSSDTAATLTGNTLTVKSNVVGKIFNIELLIDGLKVYKLEVTIKKEGYGGGYGTAQQPYLITSAAELKTLLADFSVSNNNHYQLSADIDLKGEKYDAGGANFAFNGVFDGNGYTIKNCTVKANEVNSKFPYVGLFGRNDGVIKNLTLDNIICLTGGLISINNEAVTLSVGILTGYNAGLIENCQVKNSAIRVSAKLSKGTSVLNVGGIAGYSESLIQSSAFIGGHIYGMGLKGNGKVNVGGITGTLAGARILESYVNTSKINAYTEDKATFALGGLAGNMTTRTAKDGSVFNPQIASCLVYSIEKNQNGNTFGYIAGQETDGEFANCYYIANKEQSVAGGQKNNCIRKDSIEVSSLPSIFHDNWVDGEDGPVLIIHTK